MITFQFIADIQYKEIKSVLPISIFDWMLLD